MFCWGNEKPARGPKCNCIESKSSSYRHRRRCSLLLNARPKIKIVYSVSLSIVVVNVTVIVVNLQLVTTTKYFVLATIFFASTTMSDQSRPANPSDLSVRKITDLWQKHHSCLINEQYIFYKRTALYKKSNSPLEKKAFSFSQKRTALFSETQSPFLEIWCI